MVRVFDRDSGCLRSDVDVNVIAFIRQLYYFAKGYKRDCSTKRAKAAVEEFYVVEREIRQPTLNWADDRMDLSCIRTISFDSLHSRENPAGEPRLEDPQCSADYSGITRTLELVCDYFAAGFGEFDFAEWPAKHGPGAVSDLKQDVTKFTFPSWSEKLENAFPYADLAFMDYSDWVDHHSQPCLDREQPSKLLTVPKTAKGPRLIASESVAHQWCQQILLRYFLAGIQNTPLRNSISLKDQEPSRLLVLKASLSGEYGTIDLSAASDRISCWLVERAFRRNPPLLNALHACRTRFIKNGTKIKLDVPLELPLRKFSTMGSACTFPVQSILFACISIATILFEENRRVTPRSIARVSRAVRVFGDDIIVPNCHFDAVCRNLTILGLKVNVTKSFSEGLFRESCGMDAWGGFDITPAHFNRVPDTARPASWMSVVDSASNFHKKGYWQTSAFIESTIPPWLRKQLPVVSPRCGQFGLSSFCGNAIASLKRRWNPFLQREEVRLAKLSSKVIRCPQTGRHDLFQFFTERPAPDTNWEPGRVRESSEYLTLGWEATSSFN
jgi:hypothetical protein